MTPVASTSFNLHEPSAPLTFTVGTNKFSIERSCGYRQGNHIHAEVYGQYSASTTSASTIPYFKINGTKAPSADKVVGYASIVASNATYKLASPTFATLMSSGYITQKLSSNLSEGDRLGFIIDYVED